MTNYSDLPCKCGHTLADHHMAVRIPCSCGCQEWERPAPKFCFCGAPGVEVSAVSGKTVLCSFHLSN